MVISKLLTGLKSIAISWKTSAASAIVYQAALEGVNFTTIASGFAQLSLRGKIKAVTLAIREQTAAFLATPIGMISAIALGIFAVVKVTDALTTSAAEAREQLGQIASDYQSNENEIKTLNNELTTTRDRINELKSKGKLSFTEASELKELERQNAALERKIELLEIANNKAQKTAKKDFNIIVNEKTQVMGAGYMDIIDQMTIMLSTLSGDKLTKYVDSVGDDIQTYINALQDLEDSGVTYDNADEETRKNIDRINKLIDLTMVANGQTENLWSQVYNREKFAEAKTAIENLETVTAESLANLYKDNDKVKEFIEYLLSLGTIDWETVLGKDFDSIAGDDKIVSTAEALDWMNEKGKNSAKVMGLVANELNKVEEAAEGAKTAVKSFTDIYDDIKDSFDAISEAEQDMSENGYLSAESVKALEAAGLTDYLSEAEGGYVLVNSAMQDWIEAQGAEYQTAIDTAITNAQNLATEQGGMADEYENTAESMLKYIKALKKTAIAEGLKAKQDEIDKINNSKYLTSREKSVRISSLEAQVYGSVSKLYDPTINELETAISNKNTFDRVTNTINRDNENKNSKSGSETNKTAEDKIDNLKHRHAMGLISEATYYKELEKIRKKYYAGKKDYLDRDRELQEEYHDWEVSEAEDDFEDKVEALQKKYADGKITYAQLKSKLKKLIKTTFANDKDTKNKYIDEELPDYLSDAKEQKTDKKVNAFETERSKLKRRLEMGEITEATYYKKLTKIRNKYNKSTIQDIKDGVKDIDKELHDYDVSLAEKTFKKKSEGLIQNYINQKDPIKNRKNDKKGYTFAEFKADYNKLVADVEKVDKDAAQKLKDNRAEVFKEARISKMEHRFSNLERKKEYGFITEKKYLKDYFNMTEDYYNDGLLSAEEYADNMEHLYDSFKDMYKEDYEEKRKSLEKQKEEVTKFYDDLIEKKREEHDAEDYKEEQSEKRKTLSDIERQIAELEKDGSEKAKARIAELEEERKDAIKELEDFEKDEAREKEIERLEKEREAREKEVQDKIDNIDTTLGKLDSNTKDIRNAVIQYAKAKGVDIKFAYASGTRSSVGGLGRINEKGIEMISAPDGNGNYIPMLPNSYVFSAKATEFLWKLATEHSLPQAMYNSIAKSIKTQSSTPSVNIAQPISITMGDVIIKGNADKQTVADIKKQQENTVRMVLQKIKELQK